MHIGWWGIKAKNREDFKRKLLEDYNTNVKILDTSDKDDHLWVLYNYKNLISVDCIFIDYENGEYMYKPINCESGPRYHDIPKNWISKITSLSKRKEMFPKWNHDYFKDWMNEVKGKERCIKIDGFM